MTEKKIVDQLLRLCEKQYRKGFQQGAGYINDKIITIADADGFRGDGIKESYSNYYSPLTPKKERKNNKWYFIDQLIAECQMKNMDELQDILRNHQKKQI